MIPIKIKSIRIFLGISETQVSSTIIENSYKYKRCESDTDYLTTEILILLSIIYKIPFEMFVLNEHSVDKLLKIDYINKLRAFEPEQIEVLLKDNLCSYFSEKRKRANTTTKDLILRNERKLFKETLQNIKENLNADSYEPEELGILFSSINGYLKIRTSFPSISQLIELSKMLNIPIRNLISASKEKKTDSRN